MDNTKRASPVKPADFDVIEIPGIGGCIGMTSMPGWSMDALSQTNRVVVDLDSQLFRIKSWGATILLSLVQNYEYSAHDFHDRVPEGMKHIEMAIVDQGVPDEAWEASWKTIGPEVYDTLSRGGKICVHCVGGHGRTGTIVARILVDLGMNYIEVVKLVRSVRPNCIENDRQWEYIARLLKRGGKNECL